jgi:glycosyltransferase involved in cell wall biosynthesis
MAPLVTVLMAVYNGCMHLESALASILGQTFQDFEFLIIDDGSTDGSAEILARFAAQDRRIRLLHNAVNQGLGHALHRGVEAARGQLVARMDADDLSMPTRLEKQVSFFRDHPATDVLGSYALDVDEGGHVLGERRVPVSHERIIALMWSNPIIHSTVMFRRARILAVGSYAPAVRRRQDYDLWFRCTRGGLRFANLAEPLVHYRYSEKTMCRNDIRAMWHQARVGLRGCRMIGAPPLAYAAVSVPLLEAMLPQWVRVRLAGLRKKLDPRNSD